PKIEIREEVKEDPGDAVQETENLQAVPNPYSTWEKNPMTGGYDSVINNKAFDSLSSQEKKWYLFLMPPTAKEISYNKTLMDKFIAKNPTCDDDPAIPQSLSQFVRIPEVIIGALP